MNAELPDIPLYVDALLRAPLRSDSRSARLALCRHAVPALPTAPSNLTTGVAVYEHEDFMGLSAHLTEDVLNLQSYSQGCGQVIRDGYPDESDQLDWNDCISSIKVLPPAR